MAFSFGQKFRHVVSPTPWRIEDVAGRLVEISSSTAAAGLTIIFSLVRAVQQRGDPVGWVTWTENFFYPPEAARCGIYQSSLVVVRVAERQSIARAGEKLLRSGAFGLVVLDLGEADIPMPLQSRLTGLAQRHHTALVCLTEKAGAAFSLGSLVSLRAHAVKKRTAPNRFACSLRVLKDKRRGPSWNYEEIYTGPAGLC